MALEAGVTEYAFYRGSFIRAQCKSKDSVLVTWSTGFAQPMAVETWETRAFIEGKDSFRVVEGAERDQAIVFFSSR